MSGVRNLRAMFEQKGETSPPDRGRSPGIPPTIGGSSVDGGSPRPLSKVRTNFIAVEKDGRIGLQRETSQDSSISATRKLSGESNMATPTPPVKQDSTNVFADALSRAPPKMSLQDQPIPESPRVDPSPQAAPQPPKSEPATSTPRKLKQPATDGAVDKPSTFEAVAKPKVEAAPVNGTSSAKGKEIAIDDKEEVVKPTTKRVAATASLKPISAASAPKAAGKPVKSPTASKAPKSPAESSTPKLPAKTPERSSRQPEKSDTPKTTAGSSTRSSSIKRPPPLQPSPSSTGFVKPKPKSPTRPVKLPPSLTTHTAASGSKVNQARQTQPQTSGNLQTTVDALGRSPSRASVSTVATGATKTAGTKSLKRQNSTINRPRPSLGPPPKQAARDHPPTKKEKEVDEGFLARMMRPTQASSSKASEKVPITPPRKPSTPKKVSAKVDSKGIKKAAPRATAAAGPSSRQQASSSTREVAAEAAKPTIAVEVAETAETSHVEEDAEILPDAKAEEPVEDVAIVTEKAETAQEVIGAAKGAEGEVALPEAPQDERVSPKDMESADDLVAGVRRLSLEDAQGAESALTNGNHEGDDEIKESNSVAKDTLGAEQKFVSDTDDNQTVPAEITAV